MTSHAADERHSHELRSPSRVQRRARAERKRSGRNQRRGIVREGGELLNALIGQLLTLARLESGAEKSEPVPVDLASIVREIAGDADFEARNRQRAVRVVRREDCAVSGSPELLRSAIENVVRNGVRYTAEGTEVEISLRVERDGDSTHAIISVRDHGAGVPEAALATSFRPFYRVADGATPERRVGLGLAITERASDSTAARCAHMRQRRSHDEYPPAITLNLFHERDLC